MEITDLGAQSQRAQGVEPAEGAHARRRLGVRRVRQRPFQRALKLLATGQQNPDGMQVFAADHFGCALIKALLADPMQMLL